MRALFDTRQPIEVLEYSLHFHARVGCSPIQSLVTFEYILRSLCAPHVSANLKDDRPVVLDGENQVCVRKGNSLHEFLLRCVLGAAKARVGNGIWQDARKRRGARTGDGSAGGSARCTGRRGHIGLVVVYHEVVEFLKLLLCQPPALFVKVQIDSVEPFVGVLLYFFKLRLCHRAFGFGLAKLRFQVQYFLCGESARKSI